MTAPVLQASKLCISFGGIQAVRDVDLEVGDDELVCIIGPNGAGKSSLLNLISGTMRADSGALAISGRDMRRRQPHHFARQGVVRKFQGANTFQWMTARDNLIVAGVGVAADRAEPAPDPDEILELIGLRERAYEVAECLAHGERQWLEVGMTLMCRPRLLLLDEPGAGMGPDDAQALALLLRDWARRCAIVVIEHDMAFVRSLHCRTLVMHQGAVVRDATFEEVEQDPEIRDIYLGRKSGGKPC